MRGLGDYNSPFPHAGGKHVAPNSWHAGILPVIVWLALGSAIAVSLDVVEDILFEVPHSVTDEHSVPGHEIEDAIPDIWMLSSSPDRPSDDERNFLPGAFSEGTAPFAWHPNRALCHCPPFTARYRPPTLALPPLRI